MLPAIPPVVMGLQFACGRLLTGTAPVTSPKCPTRPLGSGPMPVGLLVFPQEDQGILASWLRRGGPRCGLEMAREHDWQPLGLQKPGESTELASGSCAVTGHTPNIPLPPFPPLRPVAGRSVGGRLIGTVFAAPMRNGTLYPTAPGESLPSVHSVRTGCV